MNLLNIQFVLFNSIKILKVKLFAYSCLIILFTIASVFADDVGKVGILNNHFFIYKGTPLILIGDSATQSIMQNLNVDYKRWIDDLHSKGIRAAMLWSWMAVRQKKDGSVLDKRYGYVVPDITPWERSGQGRANDGKTLWDLKRFNPIYWERLDRVVRYAESKGIIMVITVFDGWPKTFWSHPFNMENGGPIPRNASNSFVKRFIKRFVGGIMDKFDGRALFWQLYDYDKEALLKGFDDTWPWQLKNQFFQERFAEKLIQTTCDRTNVIYELVNEGSNNRAYDQHWINFFKKRCNNLVMINDDYTPLDAIKNKDVDIVSWHSHTTDPFKLNSRWANGFKNQPPKPIIDSETVPEFYGEKPSASDFRKVIWSIAMAGGGVFVQDDTVFSFDSNAPQRPKGDNLRKYIGYANLFFNNSLFDIFEMKLYNNIVESDNAFVLGRKDVEYIIYIPSKTEVTLNLQKDIKWEARWFDPSTGKFSETFILDFNTIVPPYPDDSVLYLRKAT